MFNLVIVVVSCIVYNEEVEAYVNFSLFFILQLIPNCPYSKHFFSSCPLLSFINVICILSFSLFYTYSISLFIINHAIDFSFCICKSTTELFFFFGN